METTHIAKKGGGKRQALPQQWPKKSAPPPSLIFRGAPPYAIFQHPENRDIAMC